MPTWVSASASDEVRKAEGILVMTLHQSNCVRHFAHSKFNGTGNSDGTDAIRKDQKLYLDGANSFPYLLTLLIRQHYRNGNLEAITERI
jgi:hypothetical protein